MSVLMLDIDHFKAINDTYGHATGDKVLERIGAFIKSQIREADTAYRYGGEEFLIVMTHASSAVAKDKADSIRQSIEQLSIPDIKEGGVTVSLGVSECHVSDASPLEIIHRADKALYLAKNSGRNQVRTL